MQCTDRPFSIQEGATCWFNSIMNGFVTSKYGQVIMYRAIAKYLHEKVLSRRELHDFMDDELTYPQSGKLLTKFNFYKWFYRWLVMGYLPQRSSRIIMRNLTLSKRNTNMNAHVAPNQALFDILHRMDIDDFAVIDLNTGSELKSHPDPSFVVFTPVNLSWENPMNSLVSPHVTYNGRNYHVDHASIGIRFLNGGAHSAHAITGIRCASDGSLKLIDSNVNEMFNCDWSNLLNIVSNERYGAFCNVAYNSPPSDPIYLFVICIKTSMNRQNLNADKLNIGPQKLINRYGTAMNTNG
jgi:hypothetical protein